MEWRDCQISQLPDPDSFSRLAHAAACQASGPISPSLLPQLIIAAAAVREESWKALSAALHPSAPVALAVLAAGPAARPPHALLELFYRAPDPLFARRLLLGVRRPAYKLVARQRSNTSPRCENGRGACAEQRRAQIVRQGVHGAAGDAGVARSRRGRARTAGGGGGRASRASALSRWRVSRRGDAAAVHCEFWRRQRRNAHRRAVHGEKIKPPGVAARFGLRFL